MTDKEILQKIIIKAQKNKEYKLPGAGIEWDIFENQDINLSMDYIIPVIIFSHEFAKAFWFCDHKCKPYVSGSFVDECKKCGAIRPIGMKFEDWRSHLQNMVVVEKPLKYLEKFL